MDICDVKTSKFFPHKKTGRSEYDRFIHFSKMKLEKLDNIKLMNSEIHIFVVKEEG
jgi:hypothetical protein